MAAHIEERIAVAAERARLSGRRPRGLDELLVDGCIRLHEIEMRLLHLGRCVAELLKTYDGAGEARPMLDERDDLELRLARLRADLRDLQRFRRPLHAA